MRCDWTAGAGRRPQGLRVESSCGPSSWPGLRRPRPPGPLAKDIVHLPTGSVLRSRGHALLSCTRVQIYQMAEPEQLEQLSHLLLIMSVLHLSKEVLHPDQEPARLARGEDHAAGRLIIKGTACLEYGHQPRRWAFRHHYHLELRGRDVTASIAPLLNGPSSARCRFTHAILTVSEVRAKAFPLNGQGQDKK